MSTVSASPGVPRALGPFSLAAAHIAVLAAFWPTLSSFHEVWTSYTYSHGYLVAGLAGWLLWRGARRLRLQGEVGSDLGVPLLLGLSLLWLVATVLHVRVVHQGAFPLLLLAWALALKGWAGVREILPGASLLLFAVPFWEVFTPLLQGMTVLVSGGSVRLLGIEADISDTFITIPSGMFEVAGTCAGLNFFIIGTFLGTAYGYLFLDRWPARIVVILLGAATAIVANWIRVVGLILIGYTTEMTHGLLESHHMYGWAIFGAALGGFFLFVDRMGMNEPRKAASAVSAPIPDRVPEDMVRAGRTWLACGMLLLGPLIYFTVGSIPPRNAEVASSGPPEGPRGSWVAAANDKRPHAWRPQFDGATRELAWTWSNGTAEVIEDRVVFSSQEQGAELIGGESRIASPSDVLLTRTSWIRGQRKTVREAVIRTTGGPVLVWYWYRVAGVDTASSAWAKLLELWGFFARRPAAELHAMSTLCDPDGCADAAMTLRSLVGGEAGRVESRR